MNAYKREDKIIFENDKFIYEIELYVLNKKSWNLEDSKYFSCKEYIEDLAEVIYYDYKAYTLVKYTTLIAAHKKWLESNAELFNYESTKEIKKHLREGILVMEASNLEEALQLKNEFEDSTNKIFEYILWKNSLGYHFGYDCSLLKSIYCGTLSEKKSINQIKEYIDGKNM